MISRCGLMQKKDGMGMEEFKDYWLNVHGPIASKMANLRKYDQHVVVDAEHRHAIGQGSVVIDGYSELQFDSYGDMVEGVESLHGEGAHRRRRIRSVRGASCRRRRGDVVRNERSVRRVLRFPRIRARLCAQLGVHRGDQHLPDRNLSGCLAVCIGACDLPSKKLRFSKEEAREKGSTI